MAAPQVPLLFSETLNVSRKWSKKAFSIAQSHQCVARGTNSTQSLKINFGKLAGNDRPDVSGSRAWLQQWSYCDYALTSAADS